MNVSVQDKIAHGTYGTVYKHDHPIHGPVAIKKIYVSKCFYHPLELTIMHDFEHPNIMRALDIVKNHVTNPVTNQSQTNIDIIMPRADGDMEKFIFKHTITTSVIKECMYAILSALKALHDHNIIHVDMKANNILYKHLDDNKYHFWLSDFGLSRYVYAGMPNCRDSKIIKAYTPPENVDNNAYGKHTDVWTTALTFAHIITGKMYNSYEKWSTNKDILLNEITSHVEDPDRSLIKDLLSRMLDVNKLTRITVDQALKHPLFQDCKPVSYTFKTLSPQYATISTTVEDQQMFSRLWGVINNCYIGPRMVANAIDLYHRYLYTLQESIPTDQLTFHKHLSLAACVIIASAINDGDLRLEPADVLGTISRGTGIDVMRCTELVKDYVLNISATMIQNIYHAPLYDYVTNGEGSTKELQLKFCSLLPYVYDTQRYLEMIHNSPRSESPNRILYTPMSILLLEYRNASFKTCPAY